MSWWRYAAAPASTPSRRRRLAGAKPAGLQTVELERDCGLAFVTFVIMGYHGVALFLLVSLRTWAGIDRVVRSVVHIGCIIT